jgi:hypothetical protein
MSSTSITDKTPIRAIHCAIVYSFTKFTRRKLIIQLVGIPVCDYIIIWWFWVDDSAWRPPVRYFFLIMSFSNDLRNSRHEVIIFIVKNAKNVWFDVLPRTYKSFLLMSGIIKDNNISRFHIFDIQWNGWWNLIDNRNMEYKISIIMSRNYLKIMPRNVLKSIVTIAELSNFIENDIITKKITNGRPPGRIVYSERSDPLRPIFKRKTKNGLPSFFNPKQLLHQ